MHYTKETLDEYCKINSITITNELPSNINRELRLEGKCLTCNNNFKKSFRALIKTGGLCRNCSLKTGYEKIKETHKKNFNDPIKKAEILEKRKNTCLKKYNCENVSQNETIKCKIKETFIKKYGGYPLQCEQIKEQMKNTNFQKYNKINTFQVEKFKDKGKATCNKLYGKDYAMQNKLIQTKVKDTLMNRIGVDSPFKSKEIKENIKKNNLIKYNKEYTLQVKEIRDKGKETMIQKYNVNNPMKCPEFRDKARKTNLEKCGYEFPCQSDEFKIKYKETSQKRYGTDHPMQNKDIMEKSFNMSFKKKPYTLPSGKIIEYQGYENFALDNLLKIYHEDEIVNGTQNVPELWYETNGKKHRHYVDFYIPKENKCIEVKSIFTLKSKKDNVFDKQTYAKQQGYLYEIWVYDKGLRIEIF